MRAFINKRHKNDASYISLSLKFETCEKATVCKTIRSWDNFRGKNESSQLERNYGKKSCVFFRNALRFFFLTRTRFKLFFENRYLLVCLALFLFEFCKEKTPTDSANHLIKQLFCTNLPPPIALPHQLPRALKEQFLLMRFRLSDQEVTNPTHGQDELHPRAALPAQEVGQEPAREVLLRRPQPQRRGRRAGLLRRQEGEELLPTSYQLLSYLSTTQQASYMN